ncbi:MAG: hypothetical protein AAGB93_25300, partial [Planctomycetota bacterium]
MLISILVALAPAADPAWAPTRFDDGPQPTIDRVARLDAALASGRRRLALDGEPVTLIEVLNALDVPASSQLAVFTRSSFQARRISPRRPRAIYFSDDVYVGYVPGSDVIELTAVDPTEGLVFYTLDRAAAVPRFQRETHRCLQCHAPSRNREMPAHLVRSLHPESSGQPRLRAGSTHVDHATPYAERWGGWYVTGDAGALAHLGNQVLSEGRARLEPATGAHADLAEVIDVTRYAATTSDVVALLVMEHQTHAQNAIARAGHEARSALDYQRALNEALGDPPGTPVASTGTRLDAAAREVVDALLFAGEPPLPAPIGKDSAFAEEFQSRGPRDARGR